MEVQGGEVVCSRSHGEEMVEQGLNPGLSPEQEKFL